MSRHGRVSRTALLACGLVAAGCGARHGADVFPRAPIVVISIDTLRSDHLPMYGYKQVDTPALDGFRKDALLCERAFSHYPMTLPSHLSILSGVLPSEHGVRDNSGYRFDAGAHPYLPVLLKKAGYETGAAVSSYVLRKSTGIEQGFDFYDDDLHPTSERGLDAVQRPGAETVKLALDWLRPRAERPFFLLLHLYEPHFPYAPPEPFASRFKSRYDGEIATADAAVGDFLSELKRLGVYDRAIIVLLSDHGEGLGDHGEQQHAIFLYREDLQVPLLLKLPGSRQGGSTIHGVAELVDVAPTLLSLTGLPLPQGLPGASLLELLAGRVPQDREIYSETYYPRLHFGWSELNSLVRGPFHYIEGPDPELYEYPRDPAERRNVLADNRRIYAALHQSMNGRRRPLAAPSDIDAETSAKMASLGYLSGSAALSRGALPDPKNKRQILSDLQDAYTLANAGRHREAVAIFRRALAQDPGMVDIWALLAVSLRQLGEKQEAAAAYEKALEVSGGSPPLALAAAQLLFETGRLDEAGKHAELAMKSEPKAAYDLLLRVAIARGDAEKAQAVLERSIAAKAEPTAGRREVAVALSAEGKSAAALQILAPLGDPADPPTLCALATALSDAGRQDEALAALQKAVTKDPRYARAHELLGVVTLRLQRAPEARDHLRRALELDPKLAVSWNTLGVALYQLGDPVAALDAWQRSVALDGKQYDALFNLGLVAASGGRRTEARKALRQFVATAPPARFAADIAKAQGILKEIGS